LFDRHRGIYSIESQESDEKYEFDANGRHSKTRSLFDDRIKYAFSYEPDSGQLISIQIPNGSNLTLSTSGSNVVIENSRSQQTTLLISNDEQSQLTGISSKSGVHSKFYYDDRQLINETEIDDRKTTFDYDSTGHAKSMHFSGVKYDISLEFEGSIELTVRKNGQILEQAIINQNELTTKGRHF
jgi:YD repeat-containing protein